MLHRRTSKIVGGLGLLVVGCGRSGTAFFSQVFDKIFLDLKIGNCKHETLFNINDCLAQKNGINISYDKRLCESSCLAAPFLNQLPQQTTIIHAIREPLDWTRSYMGVKGMVNGYAPNLRPGTSPFREFFYKECPELPEINNDITRTLALWVIWNRSISPYADLTISAKTLTAAFVCKALHFAGVQVPANYEQKVSGFLEAIGTQVNHGVRCNDIQWADIEDSKWKQACEELWPKYQQKMI